jgi:hypothetical protein
LAHDVGHEQLSHRPIRRLDSTAVAAIVEVDRLLAQHALESLSPDDALLLTIETLIEVADNSPDGILNAADLASLDETLLEPLIRRGQSSGAWSSAASPSALTVSLRHLISGMLFVPFRQGAEVRQTARSIRALFTEAAENASS